MEAASEAMATQNSAAFSGSKCSARNQPKPAVTLSRNEMCSWPSVYTDSATGATTAVTCASKAASRMSSMQATLFPEPQVLRCFCSQPGVYARVRQLLERHACTLEHVQVQL